MITKVTDNILSLTDTFRIKIASSLLGNQEPYYHKKSDTNMYSRIIRWHLTIDAIKNANQLKATATMNLTGGDLLMLESLLSNVVLNNWFINAKKDNDGYFIFQDAQPRTFMAESGECIHMSTVPQITERKIRLQFSPELICVVNEFKVRELIFFLRKFDPYTYSNVSLSSMVSAPSRRQVEQLDKDTNSFFGSTPKNVSLNGTILDTETKKPKASSFFK